MEVQWEWEQIWAELCRELSRQPRCDAHPDLPCVRTLVQSEVNDIVRVEPNGIRVRSHRTGNEDIIPKAALRAWWTYLQEHGSASLSTKDPNCPRTNRAVLTGAILARCLPDRIRHDGKHLKLREDFKHREVLLPEEVETSAPLVEGAVRTLLVNAYERDANVRRRCIAAHGTNCSICGFSFGVVYGSIAERHIHVHHLRPLAEIGVAHTVDPVKDLRPVCPNCHAVVHLRKPAFSIDEVREFLMQNRSMT